MQLKNIAAEISFDIWVKPCIADDDFKNHLNQTGKIAATDNKGIYKLRINKTQFDIKLVDISIAKDLNLHLKRGCAHLVEILQVAKDGSAFLKIVFFNGDIIEMGDVEIGIDEHIKATAKRNGFKFDSTEKLANLLNDKCKISFGNEDFFLIMTSDSATADFEEYEEYEDFEENIENVENVENIEVISKDEDEKEAQKFLKLEATVQEKYRAFSIYGDRVKIPVEKRKFGETDIFFATKLIISDNQKSEGAFRLARGKVTFSDYTKTGKIATIAAGALNILAKENGSYLKKWDEYGEIEGKLLLERVRAIGVIEYTNTEKTSKGVKFFLDSKYSNVFNLLSEMDEIELLNEKPIYLENPDLSWEKYGEILEQEFKNKKDSKNPKKVSNETEKEIQEAKTQKQNSENPDQQTENKETENKETENKETENKETENNKSYDSICAKIISLSSKHIELELEDIPTDAMFLILSINGDKTQIERRMQARKAIAEASCANPLLGLIIEENGKIPQTQRVPKIKPLTAFVKDKIFKNEPTLKQKEAIEIALNTPDIVLIQGPPGTGKTTVIAAILERLNEEYNKKNSVRGQILVSSFQHDAVENVISRLSVNSLPTVKFGRRATDSQFTLDAVAEKIDDWCLEIAKNIQDKNPQITKTQEQLKVSNLLRTYALIPSKTNTLSLIKGILDLPRDLIDEKIINKANAIINSLKRPAQIKDNSTIRLIRALRLRETSFKDDGSQRAVDLLAQIDNKLSDSEIKILNKAAHWHKGEPLNFLTELTELKKTLLYKYLPAPEFSIEKQRDDVLDLASEVNKILNRKLNSKESCDRVLAEFLQELENNPYGARKAIEDYSFVYSATTQQAVSGEIKKAKTENFANQNKIKYDTVIIDEAARVSPRDLFIPMAMGEKRIILVGDHRQLPHIIDDEVAKALEDGNLDKVAKTLKEDNLENNESEDENSDINNQLKKTENDLLKKSMFEYLFERLKKLERKDGIKRTITLDAQYRTHPILGEFASNNFYKKYNEAYRSPLPSEVFEHNLNGIENKAAIWIDVPNSDGKEERLPSGSRKRIAEAQIIAEKINKWIKSPEGLKLSFGVISFYKAQVYEVYEALQKYKITEKTQDGQWQICEEFRFLENSEERLRIGTVDAFQGMEFDIVFLSMVRTQNMQALPQRIIETKDEIKKQQMLFGHLMSENRLSVSMSRQKKALILVGDTEFIKTDIAFDAVPALKNYYELCKKDKQGLIL